MRRELRELLGRGWVNLWLLGGVFLLSVGVIGFGTASMRYLDYKMNDPFINWVDVNLDQQTDKRSSYQDPMDYLQRADVQKHYHFVDPQLNYVHYRSFRTADGSRSIQFDGRSITAYSTDEKGNTVPNPILEKILEEGNVVELRGTPLTDKDLGLIITNGMAEELGYGKAPAFVAVWQAQDVEECVAAGLGEGVNGWYGAVVPVIAIVKQLPGMNSFLFTNRYWKEMLSSDPLSPVIDENNEQLLLCGEYEYLASLLKKAENEGYTAALEPYIASWREMHCLHIDVDAPEGEKAYAANRMLEALGVDPQRCTRIYNYTDMGDEVGGKAQFCSIRMTSLDSVTAFSENIYEQCGIKLEMTSIEEKNNFNFVQRMGVTLSTCIIIIVAIFILVFIYYLLQSHFLKIQRNLGTFKAFGVDNRTLQGIYTALMLVLVGVSFAGGWVVALAVAKIWQSVSEIEHGFPWIDVVVQWNGILLLLSLASVVAATWLISRKTLRKTPGDLIYDR